MTPDATDELDRILDQAIRTTQDEPDPLGAATQRFLAWYEKDGQVRELIPTAELVASLVRSLIEERLALRTDPNA
jgi:hypothetical protein